MQNAKDTLYVTMRDRLEAVNPARTCVVRGQVRVGVMVDENEEPAHGADAGVFHLQWGETTCDERPGLMVESAECRVVYRSRGGESGSELGRGRDMEAMHRELSAMLTPACVQKQRFSESGAEGMRTSVWWFEDGARVVRDKDGAVEAVATLRVMSRREDGE